MNFPMDKPIFQFFYWLVNTPGLGGIAVAIIMVASLSIYAAALRWIAGGASTDEVETYAYPTPTLEHHS